MPEPFSYTSSIILAGIALGLITGSLLGLLGGGGSVLAVPILVYVLSMPPEAAIGTSLLVMGAASVVSAVVHYRRGSVDLNIAFRFAISGGIGSLVGALIAKLIPDWFQMVMFSLLLALMGTLMLRKRAAESSAAHRPQQGGKFTVAVAGFGAGVLTGVLGVGGGFVIVPILTIILGLTMREAVGTSLLIIGANSLVGAVGHLGDITLNNEIMAFTAASIASAPAAATLAPKIPQDQLRVSFAVGLLLLSGWMLANQIF